MDKISESAWPLILIRPTSLTLSPGSTKLVSSCTVPQPTPPNTPLTRTQPQCRRNYGKLYSDVYVQTLDCLSRPLKVHYQIPTFFIDRYIYRYAFYFLFFFSLLFFYWIFTN